MMACFARQKVPYLDADQAKLIDHRFFYRGEDGLGYSTCGVARKAVADALLYHQEYFSSQFFQESLSHVIINGAITGFCMEYGVLCHLASNGIPLHQYLDRKKMRVVQFNTDVPKIETNAPGLPVIYHPEKSNFPAIDGIIVYVMGENDPRYRMEDNPTTAAPAAKGRKAVSAAKGRKAVSAAKGKKAVPAAKNTTTAAPGAENNQKQQLLLCPYQVTVNRKSHTHSDIVFFEKMYAKFVKDLKEFEVVTQFIWFTDESKPDIPHSSSDSVRMKLKSGRIVRKCDHDYLESYVCFGDLSKELGEKYAEALKDKRSRRNSRKAFELDSDSDSTQPALM